MTRSTILAAALATTLAACGDDGPGGDGGGSSTNPNLSLSTSNGSPAAAPVFTTTRPSVPSKLTLTLENTTTASTGIITLTLGAEPAITLDTGTTCIDAEITASTCDIALKLDGMVATSYATELSIQTEAAGNLVVPLAGEVTLPDVSVTPTTYNFGTVPVGTTHTFTLRNNDTVAFNGAINANGPFAVSGDCVLPIAPASSCSIILGVDTDGPFTGSLAISLDATNMITVPISGTGT